VRIKTNIFEHKPFARANVPPAFNDYSWSASEIKEAIPFFDRIEQRQLIKLDGRIFELVVKNEKVKLNEVN